MKYVLGLAIGILLTVIVGYFLLVKKAPVSTTTSNITSSATSAPTPIATRKVTGGGILSFPKYELLVAEDWADSRESGTDMEKLTLKKSGYQISISEGGFGGAICLFPGDADTEGPSGRYEKFVDLTTRSANIFRRVIQTGGGSICEKTQYGWGSPSSYGHISITIPDPADTKTVGEIDTILSSFLKI